MLISATLLPLWLHAIAALLMFVSVAAAARYAEWRAVTAVPARQHVLFGSMLALFGIWLLSVRLADGIALHLSLIPALTLVVGWRFACLCGAVVTAAHAIVSGNDWLAIPVAWLITVAVPASVTRLLAHLLRRTNIQNLFFFMLGAGFFGSILAVVLCAVIAMAVLAVSDASHLLDDALRYWALLFPIAFQEAFINGLIITALTVFVPGIVKTFDERFYLDEDDE